MIDLIENKVLNSRILFTDSSLTVQPTTNKPKIKTCTLVPKKFRQIRKKPRRRLQDQRIKSRLRSFSSRYMKNLLGKFLREEMSRIASTKLTAQENKNSLETQERNFAELSSNYHRVLFKIIFFLYFFKLCKVSMQKFVQNIV